MIRPLRPADLPVCLDWYNHYIRTSLCTFETEELSILQFEERVQQVTEEYPWIVLEKEGKIKGYAYLSHFNDRAAYDWTADVSVYVAPAQKGKGYGGVLLRALIEEAEKLGYKQLVSIIAEGNTASEHLHSSCGFTKKAFFEKIGCKHGVWLGVSYWTYHITSEFEASPVHPACPQREDTRA